MASFVGFTAPVWQSGSGDSMVDSARHSIRGVRTLFGRATSLFSSGSTEAAWGPPYWEARGEILRPSYDDQQRRQWANLLPLIKNESKGIEDDQIPL